MSYSENAEPFEIHAHEHKSVKFVSDTGIKTVRIVRLIMSHQFIIGITVDDIASTNFISKSLDDVKYNFELGKLRVLDLSR